MHFKVKEIGRVIAKAFYTVLGINQNGYKDILGIYIQDSEGSNFWLSVLTDLQNRGVKDILIACIDGLVGFGYADRWFMRLSNISSLKRSSEANAN